MTAPPTPRADEVVHPAVRLRIRGLLRRVAGLEVGVVRDTLGVSDAHLSTNLEVLADGITDTAA